MRSEDKKSNNDKIPRQRMSKDIETEIINAIVKNNETQTVVAQRYGFDRSTVSKLLKRKRPIDDDGNPIDSVNNENIDTTLWMKYGRKRLSMETQKEIINAVIMNNEMQGTVAERYGVDRSTVSKLIKRNRPPKGYESMNPGIDSPWRKNCGRSRLSIDTQVEILNAVLNNFESRLDVAARYKIDKSTVSKLIKRKESVLKAKAAMSNKNLDITSDSRQYKEAEEALNSWLQSIQKDNPQENVTNQMICEKAKEMVAQFFPNDNKFTATRSWLNSFKAHYRINKNDAAKDASIRKRLLHKNKFVQITI